MGLDVGERRIGVAISDPERRLAVPLHSVIRDGRGSEMDALAKLVAIEEIVEVVAGLPLSLSGVAGQQAQITSAFAAELERRLGLPVHLWDERLSTHEAMRLVSNDRRGGRGGRGRQKEPDTDALAASIILQAYIDRLRFKQSPSQLFDDEDGA